MIKTQLAADKLAMTLSMVCVVHCFITPSFLILTSGLLPFSFDNEFIHNLILLVAVPISLFALTEGYRNHKSISFLPFGIAGMLMLIFAVLLGEIFLGEFGEKGLTLLGSIFVACSHLKNYQACKKSNCSCHER